MTKGSFFLRDKMKTTTDLGGGESFCSFQCLYIDVLHLFLLPEERTGVGQAEEGNSTSLIIPHGHPVSCMSLLIFSSHVFPDIILLHL